MVRDGKSRSVLQVIVISRSYSGPLEAAHNPEVGGLAGFEHADPSRQDMTLLCAVYLDLPLPYQAYLFATINYNQKKVNKSLAYMLFGFDVEDSPPDSWSPEKAAVLICRKLNVTDKSPFYKHIIVAAQDSELLFPDKSTSTDWRVSTAAVVEGILSLISSNPKRDRDIMNSITLKGGRSRKLLDPKGPPLRSLYLECNDVAIFTAVNSFFAAASGLFWTHASSNSYIRKTVGIQALFDVLKKVLESFTQDRNLRVEYFRHILSDAKDIDFANDFFQASGKGRSRIRNIILLAIRRLQTSDLPQTDDIATYNALLNR